MIYYIADLHIGHQNVIAHDSRPFDTLEDMHTAIIKNWNSAVTERDTVFVLGDFAWKSDEGVRVMKQLKGTKVLIRGNHDNKLSPELRNMFTDVVDYSEITDNNRRVIMCHYPIAHWNHQFRGAVHLYGHVHNNKDYEVFDRYIKKFSNLCCKTMPAFNVGCMMPYMNYTPRTLTEIIEGAL